MPSAAPGDFASIPGLDKSSGEYLKDVYDAVTLAEKWDDFKNHQVESFMFSAPSFVNEVHKHMKLLDSHSGASYGYVMRTIEFIAKNGWEAFQDSFQN